MALSGDLGSPNGNSVGSNDQGTNEALSAAFSQSPPSVNGDRVVSPRIVLRDTIPGSPEPPVVRCTSRQCKKALPPEYENPWQKVHAPDPAIVV